MASDERTESYEKAKTQAIENEVKMQEAKAKWDNYVDRSLALAERQNKLLEEIAGWFRTMPNTTTNPVLTKRSFMPELPWGHGYLSYQAAALIPRPPSPEDIAFLEAPRNGKWPRLRKIHMTLHPDCAVCESRLMCVPHHKKPFHLFPELELDPDNLITFCPPHHLLVGHLMNWRAYNPYVEGDAKRWRDAIARRPLDIIPAHEMRGAESLVVQTNSEVKCDALFLAHPEITEDATP